MISFKHRGDLSKATRYFGRLREAAKLKILEQYAQEGVKALSSATPVDTGQTSGSWNYKIEHRGSGHAIVYHNSHTNGGVNIAVILQYGHGTGTGGWVEGRDYINPAIRPVFDNIANKAWEEVTKV